jgi:hypothetical protein
MTDIATALRALASKLRESAGAGFDHTPNLTPAGYQALVQKVLGVAEEVDALADEVWRHFGREEFDALMDRLRSVGKRPPDRLVIAVERAIAAAGRCVRA